MTITVSRQNILLRQLPYSYNFQLHNKYFRAKKSSRELHRGVQFHNLVFERLEEIISETETERSTFNRRCDLSNKFGAPLNHGIKGWYKPETVNLGMTLGHLQQPFMP